MALNELFMLAGPLNQYFVDKTTGLPLASGVLKFFKDSSPVTPKPIYRLNGSYPEYTYVALPNPLTLSSVGTIVDASNNQVIPYYYPYDDEGNIDLYYITCEDSGGTSQWTRKAFPNITSNNNPAQEPFSVANQISNSQFAHTFNGNLNSTDSQSLILTVSSASEEVFNIAPMWDMVISGTGTVTIIQTVVAGDTNLITNPPYYLDIVVSAGVTECLLKQKFLNNSGLWTSTDSNDIYLSGAFVAKNVNSGTVSIEMYYNESLGNSPTLIMTNDVDNSAFILYSGISDAIPASNNTQTGETAYSEIYLNIPLSSHIQITSLQIIPSRNSSDIPQFDLISSDRIEAYLGSYYFPILNKRHTDNILVGWDFKNNPAQILGTTVTINNAAAYIWDQTIAKRTLFNLTAQRNGTTGGLQIINGGAANSFYIMQYLDTNSIYELLENKLSVNVQAYTTNATTRVTARIYLFYGNSSASFPTLPTDLGTLNNDGTFTLSFSNWNSISRGNLPVPLFALKNITANPDINSGMDNGFTGWEITDTTAISNTKKFAILVSFYIPDAATNVTIDSVCLTPNEIPSRPIVEEPLTTLKKCRYYYETSYPISTYPGVTTRRDVIIEDLRFTGASTTVLTVELYKILTLQYAERKRTQTPTFTTYSPSVGTVSSVDFRGRFSSSNTDATTITDLLGNYYYVNFVSSENLSYYPIVIAGSQVFEQVNLTISAGTAPNNRNSFGWIEYHYVIDARLGVVA